MNSVETGRRRSRKTELGERIKTDRIVEFFPAVEEEEEKTQEYRNARRFGQTIHLNPHFLSASRCFLVFFFWETGGRKLYGWKTNDQRSALLHVLCGNSQMYKFHVVEEKR